MSRDRIRGGMNRGPRELISSARIIIGEKKKKKKRKCENEICMNDEKSVICGGNGGQAA